MQYHIKQQQFYLHLYEQLQIRFIYFISEELIFFENHQVKRDKVLQIFIWVIYHKNLIYRLNLQLQTDT